MRNELKVEGVSSRGKESDIRTHTGRSAKGRRTQMSGARFKLWPPQGLWAFSCSGTVHGAAPAGVQVSQPQAQPGGTSPLFSSPSIPLPAQPLPLSPVSPALPSPLAPPHPSLPSLRALPTSSVLSPPHIPHTCASFTSSSFSAQNNCWVSPSLYAWPAFLPSFLSFFLSAYSNISLP